MASRRAILKAWCSVLVAVLASGRKAIGQSLESSSLKSHRDLPLDPGAKVVGFGHSFIQRSGWGIVVDGIPRDLNSSNTRGVLPWIRLWDHRFNLDVFLDVGNPLGKDNSVSGAFQGVGGDHVIAEGRSPGTISRTQYIIARAPDIIYLDIGTNDISGGTSANELIRRLDEQIGKLLSAGIWVVIQTITDRKSWPEGHPKQKIVRAVNEWIKTRHGKVGLKVCDVTELGFNYPSYDESLFGGDFIHPNPKGGKTMARHLLPILQGMVRAGEVSELDDVATGNLWPSYGLFGTGGNMTAGAAVGEVATGHKLVRAAGDSTAHCSKEAVNGQYEKQVITFAPSGTITGSRVEQWRFCASKWIDLSKISVTPGQDWLESFVFVEVSPWDGWLSLEWQISADGRQPYVVRGGLLNPDSPTQLLPLGDTGFHGWLKICRFQVPQETGPNRLRIDNRPLVLQFDRQATGTGTIKISRPVLRKATNPRAVWNLT